MTKVLLIVDDEATLLEVVSCSLNGTGCTVIQAGNGQEAFNIVNSTPIDLVLSDVNMSPGDGVELLLKIREAGHQMPIVMMTGYCSDSQRSMIQSSADCVLEKPFSISKLKSTIDSLIQRSNKSVEKYK